MTKFADQLFDDLMREYGPALARTGPAPTGPSAPTQAPSRRHLTARRTLLASGGTLAVAGAIAGTLVAGGGTRAYAVTENPDDTITLAVYQQAGIAQANTRLRQLGDQQLVVVPIRADCPKPRRPPATAARQHRYPPRAASRWSTIRHRAANDFQGWGVVVVPDLSCRIRPGSSRRSPALASRYDMDATFMSR